MFISIKGYMGKFRAEVTGFYKDNLDYLIRHISIIYFKEYRVEVPSYFYDIATIKDLKTFVKEEMSDMDNYPYGFKYIDGVFCLYECFG